MTYVADILALSFGITFAVLFFAMAVGGIRRGKVFYEPSCPPIPFSDRPIAFVALCALYVALSMGAAGIVIWAGRHLLASP